MALKSLGARLPAFTRRVLGKKGDAFAAVVAEWPQIVGAEIAQATLPESLGRSSGILVVRVDGAIALEIQHLAPQLIERINRWLGRIAVTRIRLVRGVVGRTARPSAPRAPRRLTATEEAAIARATDAIADPDLAAALRRLGRSLAAKS
jgi:hypothetical protein